MYESSKESQSIRVFVGPFTVGDPALFSAWFVSSDLGMPRILPAVTVAGNMLASAIRNAFQQLVLWVSDQKGAARARAALQPVPVRQGAEPAPAPTHRDEAA